MKLFILVILVLCAYNSEQKSTPQDDHYVAAVVEYIVQSGTNRNLENYYELIKNASLQDADVVVFPEMTLSSFDSVEVPIHGDLLTYPVPALNPEKYHNILVKLSESAKEYQLYVVVNIQEIMNCSTAAAAEECTDEEIYRFNTNVVFDRNGAVIDRYRKINLFGEFSRSPAWKPDLGIFDTDFGVTFGHFICFDLLFQIPAIQVIQKHNIKDVIFPTMWFSELPYLTAVEIQEAYAYVEDINFLAAGANSVRVGSAGSGIYSGKAGALISIMPGTPTTRLLVARVPKIPGQVTASYPGHQNDDAATIDNLFMKRDPSLGAHRSRLLEPGNNEFTLEDHDVKCEFNVTFNYKQSDKMPILRAFVHDSTNTYATRILGTSSCSVITCSDENPVSCPFRSKENNLEFESIEIEMQSKTPKFNETLQCNDSIYYPSTFTNTKSPLSAKNYTYTIEKLKDMSKITMKLNSKQNGLVVFGIWGRDYSKDGVDDTITAEDLKKLKEVEALIFSNEKNVQKKQNPEL